jgi:DNA repair exonuclease SbcCD ATPase subunit
MTTMNQLVEQHITKYESHLKHIDELLERAHEGVAEGPEYEETRAELEGLQQQREKLASHLDELRLKSLENWREEEIEKSGPMGIWDAVAQQLEKLVERLGGGA